MFKMTMAGGTAALRPGDLIGPAARGLTEAAPRLWPVLLGLAAASAAASVAMSRALEAAESKPASELALTMVGWLVASNMISAAAAVPAFRILIGRAETAWRLDGAALRFFAFELAMALVSGVSLAPVLLAPDPTTVEANPSVAMAYAGRVLLLLALLPVLIWASLRLALFPLGLIVGEPNLSLARSWRRMRGAAWAYLVALVALAAMPIGLGLAISSNAAFGMAGEVVASVFTSVAAMAATSVAAELYRRRGASDVARVFD